MCVAARYNEIYELCMKLRSLVELVAIFDISGFWRRICEEPKASPKLIQVVGIG